MNVRHKAAAALVVLIATLPGCHGGHRDTGPSSGAGSVPSDRPVGSILEPSPSTTTLPPLTAPAPTTTVPPRPPFQVVSTTLPFVDSSRPTVSHGVRLSPHRALTTVVWYPVPSGPWPLVLFAAGFRVGPETYNLLLRSWATEGYVVAAPQFPLEDQAVAGTHLDEGDLPNEPADVSFVLGALTSPSQPLSAEIRASRVGVAGHSDGAEVALAVAQSGNPAIKAAIIMSGQPVATPAAGNPPILVAQGSLDTINPPSLSQAVYAAARQPRYYLDLLGAAHLPPFAGTAPWSAVVDAVTLDFLNRYLAGQASSDAALRADGSRPGVASLTAGANLSG